MDYRFRLVRNSFILHNVTLYIMLHFTSLHNVTFLILFILRIFTYWWQHFRIGTPIIVISINYYCLDHQEQTRPRKSRGRLLGPQIPLRGCLSRP